MSSLFCFSDSRNRESGSNSYFSISFDDNNFTESEISIGLDSAVIPNLVYPIRDGRNTLVFTEGATVRTAVIAEGNYDADSFPGALKTAMEASGSVNTFTITISDTTNKLTISSTGNFSLRFANSSADMWKILGFAQSSTTSTATTATGIYPVRLDGDEYLIVELMSVSNNNLCSGFTSSYVLDMIPLNSGFGDVIYYKANVVTNYTTALHNSLKNLRIRLLDPNGFDWPLPANANVMIKLACENTMTDY